MHFPRLARREGTVRHDVAKTRSGTREILRRALRGGTIVMAGTLARPPRYVAAAGAGLAAEKAGIDAALKASAGRARVCRVPR